MVKQQLQVFVRIKPSSQKQKAYYSIISDQVINLQVSRIKMSNAKDYQQYYFKQVFSQKITQLQIFNRVAKPVIDNCLDGYNGTIFTYGQTGSGKTYTMSGGDQWNERGIIPRVLAYIYQLFKVKQGQYEYQLSVSFIEIYNENAYDLLNRNSNEASSQNWVKIIIREDEQSNIQMKNVEDHKCKNEQQALNYLMMGNFNKKINATTLNQYSSRSHCIFTINIKGVDKNTLVQIYSKIHLVDLAGSQRVSKSQAEGVVLTQAKSINLSLSYLQQVILALNQKAKSKAKQHIPYRNSLLTTLLKDSLGGNCKTVMIATISMELSNIDETISTLRFSQRVKKIENQIQKNQKNIYTNQIQVLEKQNMVLKKKLLKYQKQNIKEMKNYQNQEQLKKYVQDFMKNKVKLFEIQTLHDANFCFKQMKQIYNKKMRQYATELTFISEKLEKYDEILTKRQNNRRALFQ